MKLFLLGAGEPAHGDKPSALKKINTKTNVLDWNINTFTSKVEKKNIYFLGGYNVEQVISDYPELNFCIIPNWRNKTPLHTLLKAPFDNSDILVSYSDTVFRKSFIEELDLNGSDVLFCFDSLWRSRYLTRTNEDIKKAETITINNQEVEFTGLIYFSKKIVKVLEKLNASEVGKSLIDLIKFLTKNGYSVNHIDIKGEWAEFNSSADIANFILGTKAESLARLEPVVKKSVIGKQVMFTSGEWKKNSLKIISKLRCVFKDKNLVIRSSNNDEDNWHFSNAGEFESILNVDIHNDYELTKAVNSVISSYGHNLSSSEQILVQAFLKNVEISGVIFTCGLESGSPYYRINFDDISKSTDSVTGGTNVNLRTIILSKFNISYLKKIEILLLPVLESVIELENLLNYEKLDIEFAIDKFGQVNIFQVRPIVVNHSDFDIDQELIKKSISDSKVRFDAQQKPSPFIYGKKNIFANMPDWNPAEIIGTRPKPLAFSLYRELITNDIWARQRFEFGYCDVRSHPLIYSFSGQPYVDTRASINSFIPNNLTSTLKTKLANCYLDLLYKNPNLHDKLEFDIAFTIWIPNFFQKAKNRFINFNISESDIKILENELKNITRKAFLRLDSDTSNIKKLQNRREKIFQSELSPLSKALALLDDTQVYGTLAFAHAARAGFIASSFLKAFVDNNIFSVERKSEFLNSFHTITGDFKNDKYLYSVDRISFEILLKKYGHLRPGTYELNTKAYWEDPKKYLSSEEINTPTEIIPFTLTTQENTKILNILEELKSPLNASELLSYFTNAIKAREYTKFEFTKNLSKALDYIILFGKINGISTTNLSFLEYEDLLQLKLNITNLDKIKKEIKNRKKNYLITQFVELPAVIKNSNDFYCFERLISQPNFVTTKNIVAAVLLLNSNQKVNLSGKIVLISQADPGFDWIFSHKIAGLITQYGGANSHMAIRTAELGVPAAIGVGEKLYENISTMKKIELDCSNQIIREV